MATLTSLLRQDAVPLATLEARYGALLELVRRLIGVVPNCDPYLEIWPAAFRTYNVMVPNFLNLPFLIWGMGAPRDIVGLAIYVASRTSGCAYCSAHTCSFALRRGVSPDKVAFALQDDDQRYTPAERAAIAVARALARVPADLSEAERQELRRHFSPAHVEWIVLAVAMMGFLNKFMDALGVELEAPTIAEVNSVLRPSGWTAGKHLAGDMPADGAAPPADSLAGRLGVLRYAPAAISLDRRWTAGVPDRWPAAGDLLRQRVGYDFPVLSRLRHGRAIRAITMILRDNLDAPTSVLGLETKLAAGLIYADTVGDAALAAEVRRLGGKEVPASPALLLARAISPSPASVDDSVAAACHGLPAAAIVELVTWISVLQLLHRLTMFYPAN